ncbi:MAG: CoB--CoM heterodisulfide reductase iron-sulfur subunit B family protein [Desulfobacteraceae bacterium]|nr:CoB--CoM heterodisulfide reductase iron-sulfur subunit B family protein [Desulfobacteraceae bacterium]
MKYLYYPGCSLESTAREYDLATRAVMHALGAELIEIPDWTCCGATAAKAVDRRLALAMPAVSLALAETVDSAADILVPCSACYLNLKKVHETAATEPRTLSEINEILSDESLHYSGKARPRHILDILSKDIGPAGILQQITNNLSGLRVAPYYGCQCLRPYRVFDDPEAPNSMAALLAAAGADLHPWSMAASCCGASHMTTNAEVSKELVFRILKSASGADAIATVCPMCQMNLEGYQGWISSRYGEDVRIPVYYLPQLLGLAMGIPAGDLGLDAKSVPAAAQSDQQPIRKNPRC